MGLPPPLLCKLPQCIQSVAAAPPGGAAVPRPPSPSVRVLIQHLEFDYPETPPPPPPLGWKRTQLSGRSGRPNLSLAAR